MEEAPTPEKLSQEKNDFTLISNKNNSFSISIIKFNYSIEIVAKFKDELLTHLYKTELSLEEFKKNNRYFLLYEKIDEIYNDLILLMNKNQTKLFEENGSIKIIIPLESVKIKEISFIIKEEIRGDKDLIKELFTLIKELKEENNSIKEEIKEIKQENKELKSKINKLEGYIPILEEYKNQNEKEKEIQSLNSLITNDNINYKKQIIKWIKQKTNKEEIKFEKIFTMSINGSSSKDFHNYCDNKGPTLTLVKTTQNKIFGGFTPLNWDNNSGFICDKDNQTFIFSLNLMKKYDMINSENSAIQCNRFYGPYFGVCDFGIRADMKKGNSYANSKCNFLSGNNLELTGGKGENEIFDVENFEVFKVNF